MAAECSQEAVLDFLRDGGGKVKNCELMEHFRRVFPAEPQKKAEVRSRFKVYVDTVAYVKTEDGVKYVCMKKKFRGSVKEAQRQTKGGCGQVSTDDVSPSAPGSGSGNDSQVRPLPHVSSSDNSSPEKNENRSAVQDSDCVFEEVNGSSGEMGNLGSLHRTESKKEQTGRAHIPEISVIQASPLPADGSMFNLPTQAQTDPAGGQVGPAGQVKAAGQVESLLEVEEVIRRRRQVEHQDEGEEEGDARSLSGSEGATSPKGSRKHFIQVMISSSPQVRRSMVFRGSAHLSHRSDSDSASLHSGVDEDRTSLTLDPLEHEWMLTASDAEWGALFPLLASDPSLVCRKDFITGFTCLHWAAKHGKHELLAMVINFAKQNNVPISVDARSNLGYTPLHVAAMQNHMEVVKLLVGAYGADVEIRDYSGRKACQYLTDSASMDIRDIIGAPEEHTDSEGLQASEGARSRFSKVLHTNLKPLRLLQPDDVDSVDGEERPRVNLLRRKSSLSKMKPKLQRIRDRTSQILHSTSFRGPEDLEESARGSFRSRPKTHFFG